MRTAQTVLTVIQERGKQHKPIERVYKLLFNRDFYLNAYAKLYPNNGAMTKGVTDETVDGMSIQKIDRMIELLREEKYQWKPARREYIPKKNGKKRPLGIPTWGDKLLQEVMREILEAYYEPQFSNHSHGFRPNRGCHTALQEIQIWKGTRWFIEGDISKYFDTIDHDVLLKILEKNIHDGRFLRLISNMLKAGYLDDWKFNQTISGTPQGGVISPLLANIYLNEFDQWIENTLIPQYTKGKRQKSNPVYNRMNAEISKARKNGDMQTAHKLEVERRNIPSVDPYDETYRRCRYVRYADDFLIGFTGSKADAEEIKAAMHNFLENELHLELSQEKTLITSASSQAAKFLGYEIKAQRANDYIDPKGRRGANGAIALLVPAKVIESKCQSFKRNGNATDEEVYAAAKAACCDDFIARLEKGYDTPAGDAGKRLSGGEKQRIAIARAILKNAPIVILDEATAFTDPQNEDKIQKSIMALSKGKTLLVIAHRLSTIQNADQIVVLKKGQIVDCGKQGELLERCPLYADMWQAHIGAKNWSVGEKKEVAVNV